MNVTARVVRVITNENFMRLVEILTYQCAPLFCFVKIGFMHGLEFLIMREIGELMSILHRLPRLKLLACVLDFPRGMSLTSL
jgi:hypothetical protein